MGKGVVFRLEAFRAEDLIQIRHIDEKYWVAGARYSARQHKEEGERPFHLLIALVRIGIGLQPEESSDPQLT